MKKHLLLIAVILFSSVASYAENKRDNWQREDLDLRVDKNIRIKGIKYPKDKPVPTRTRKQQQAEPDTVTLSLTAEKATVASTIDTASSSGSASAVYANAIDLPPVDGFIPWIAVATTNEKSTVDMDWVAAADESFSVSKQTGTAATDFAIGLFDTGASAHVMGYENAERLGLNNSNYLTNSEIEVSGVTGSVSVSVSYPLGIFIQGLSAINAMGILDTTQLVGETNTSIAVGQDPGTTRPDLPTAIGTPLSVYYDTSFDNDNPVTFVRDSNGLDEVYTAPDIRVLPKDSLELPEYPNTLPLELRPLGALNVQYVPDLNALAALTGDLEDWLNGFDFSTPGSPSVITGNLTQSVFIVHSVDLSEGGHTASDKDRFMLDTGAQVTVIGKRVAARLELDENDPDFLVEIQGVTGDTEDMPGFYIDSIEIPALGQWLRFTNVPVVLLDVFSPEGGTLDGIIGMNLFVDYNFVLKGGGIFLTDDPAIQFERRSGACELAGDIAPSGGDCSVDILDLTLLAEQWQQMQAPSAGLAEPQNITNLADFAVIATNWLVTGQ